MSHKKLRPFIVKVSVLGYFPLHAREYACYVAFDIYAHSYSLYVYIYIKYLFKKYIKFTRNRVIRFCIQNMNSATYDGSCFVKCVVYNVSSYQTIPC